MSNKKKAQILAIAIVLALIALGGALWGPIVSNVEQAKYTTLETSGNIEIREYAPMIVAETTVLGDRKEAINTGFRLIADYIFGNNSTTEKVAMTAPVIQQSGRKIAMTAPVTQQSDGRTWGVRFVMPSDYTLASLPKPNNPKVKIKELKSAKFAIIRFSGLASEDNLQKYTQLLLAFVKEKNVKASGEPVYAFFNPPWTLPFLRRNEIMLEVLSEDEGN